MLLYVKNAVGRLKDAQILGPRAFRRSLTWWAAGLHPQSLTSLLKASEPKPACCLSAPLHQQPVLIQFDCFALLKNGPEFGEDVEVPSLVVSYAFWLQSTEKA